MWWASDSGNPATTPPRIIRMVSPNPAVAMRPVRAPLRVISVLSPMVQAW